jgi:hypothetical protein
MISQPYQARRDRRTREIPDRDLLFGRQSGVAMPLTNAAKEIYRLAIREGHGDEDISAIHGYLAQNRDAEISSRL